MEIDGKVAFVSGGGSGIGRAVVLALAIKGAKVVIADINEAAGQQAVNDSISTGKAASFVPCDVVNTDELVGAFEYTADQFGRLDIVFNNAGIGGVDLFGDKSDGWKRVVDVNLTAVIDATRIAVTIMKRLGKGGVIINTASLIGLFPMGEAPVYGAAKAGVIHFSRSLNYLAKEDNIRVNAICPELVDTPMAVLGVGEKVVADMRATGSILKPEDIANSVIELIEDNSRAGEIMQITNEGGRKYVEFG